MKLDGAHQRWAQCPKCHDVMHQSCFDRWVLNGSGLDSLHFSCPSCRHVFDRSQYESNPDPWSAADLQSTLAEVANESDDDKSDNQEEDDSDTSTRCPFLKAPVSQPRVGQCALESSGAWLGCLQDR